ncbi:hypothetical protein H4219_003825 [Mycoemilia scoparia]|uniref:Tyrosinase copper-binding domain-containing protein n=1 Tax=Mycoemilia scoparia TaxID=417184 RepID=A0A9W8DS45_9FUNG|nr:hypothetical protein H4219_003825 [Mycoemilia scoparia]
MKVSLLIAVVAPFLLGTTNAQQTLPRCSSTYTRKEIRSLTPTELATFKTVLTDLNRVGWTAWFSYVHTANFGPIHGNSMFFPFHRRFLLDFETVARSFNPSFVAPYWDSARDYAAPQNSQVLTSNYIGGNGGSNGCISNGFQSQLTMTYPNSHCLSRRYNGNGGTIQTWYSPEYILSLVQSDTTMARFRPDIEYSIHGAVHLGLGGDFAQTFSPNDAAFWLHHANIDRLWWLWQNINNRMWLVDGPGPNGGSMQLSTTITSYSDPVSSVIQLGYGRVCYNYAASANAPTNTATPQLKMAGSPAALAAGPVAGSSGGSETQVASNLIVSLPDSVKQDFFPSFATGSGSSSSAANALVAPSASASNSTASAAGDNNLARRESRRPMPRPFPLPDSWIRMHGFNPQDVRDRYQRATRFVSTLNSADYISPFV